MIKDGQTLSNPTKKKNKNRNKNTASPSPVFFPSPNTHTFAHAQAERLVSYDDCTGNTESKRTDDWREKEGEREENVCKTIKPQLMECKECKEYKHINNRTHTLLVKAKSHTGKPFSFLALQNTEKLPTSAVFHDEIQALLALKRMIQ